MDEIGKSIANVLAGGDGEAVKTVFVNQFGALHETCELVEDPYDYEQIAMGTRTFLLPAGIAGCNEAFNEGNFL